MLERTGREIIDLQKSVGYMQDRVSAYNAESQRIRDETRSAVVETRTIRMRVERFENEMQEARNYYQKALRTAESTMTASKGVDEMLQLQPEDMHVLMQLLGIEEITEDDLLDEKDDSGPVEVSLTVHKWLREERESEEMLAKRAFAAEVEASLLSHPAVAQVRAPARPRAVTSCAPQRHV